MELLHRGKFLELVRSGRWEFARRSNARAVVGILPVTVDDTILLVEQFRPAVGTDVLELPAGLVGDEPGQSDEPLQQAAARELREETGYESNDWLSAGRFSSSAGLTDETTILFVARQCYQTGPGGGVGRESLRIHEIPRVEAASWLQTRVKSGQLMDAKIWAALWFLDQNG